MPRVVYLPRAQDEIRALPAELRPAVLEHLSRLAAHYQTYSRPTCFPHAPGLLSALWCRHGDGRATLVEVHFRLEVRDDLIAVRRVILVPLDSLPYYAANPAEFHASVNEGWPVVDL